MRELLVTFRSFDKLFKLDETYEIISLISGNLLSSEILVSDKSFDKVDKLKDIVIMVPLIRVI